MLGSARRRALGRILRFTCLVGSSGLASFAIGGADGAGEAGAVDRRSTTSGVDDTGTAAATMAAGARRSRWYARNSSATPAATTPTAAQIARRLVSARRQR